MRRHQARGACCRGGAPGGPARERGMTLVELMVGLAVVSIVLCGTVIFLVFQTQVQNASQVRSGLLAAGQAAMAVLEREIGLAGFDLPRRLAIKEHAASDDPCEVMLAVASVDPLRQWTASTTTTSTITLASATPEPAADESIAAGSWLYLFHSWKDGPLTASDRGYGMARVGPNDRLVGETAIGVNWTNFSACQSALDLDVTAPINQPRIDGRPIQVLRAKVSTFGVECTGTNPPYLYWERAGFAPLPLVSTVTELRFRFLTDQDSDGVPDDVDGDGAIGVDDLYDTYTGLADPTKIVAVHVLLRLQSDSRDPASGDFRTQVFSELIQTPNIHTETDTYLFIDNSGL